MKILLFVFATIVSNLTSACATISAAYLAYEGTKGWGWFLLIAVLTNVSPRLEKSLSEDKKSKTQLLME